MNRVIITGDDFGLTFAINRSIRNSIEKGVMNAASIMVLRDKRALEDAISMAQKIEKKASLGLHLDLDHWFRFDETGHYGMNENDVIHEFREIIEKNRAAIADDINAQVEILIENSIPVSHCDGHHNIHLFPDILDLLVPVMKKNNIPAMRFNADFYCPGERLAEAEKIIATAGITVPDQFYDLSEIMSGRKNVDSTENSTVEIMAHTCTEDNRYGRVDQYHYLLQHGSDLLKGRCP